LSKTRQKFVFRNFVPAASSIHPPPPKPPQLDSTEG
jgi:hypothetical protein